VSRLRMVGAAGRNDRISLCIVIVVFLYLTSHAARDGEKRMSRHARVKREEAKQGLSLHDVRMNGLTIRGIIRTGDAGRIDCPAPMLAAMLFGAVGII
jgi:hypothetical protein